MAYAPEHPASAGVLYVDRLSWHDEPRDVAGKVQLFQLERQSCRATTWSDFSLDALEVVAQPRLDAVAAIAMVAMKASRVSHLFLNLMMSRLV